MCFLSGSSQGFDQGQFLLHGHMYGRKGLLKGQSRTGLPLLNVPISSLNCWAILMAIPRRRCVRCPCCFISRTCVDVSWSQKDFTAAPYAMLTRFGYPVIQEELGGPNIHRLENVLTLDKVVQDFFDQLHVWFEAVPNEVCIPESGQPRASTLVPPTISCSGTHIPRYHASPIQAYSVGSRSSDLHFAPRPSSPQSKVSPHPRRVLPRRALVWRGEVHQQDISR